MSARFRSRLRNLARSVHGLARLVVDAWPVLVGGWLPDLADQVPACRERQDGHPAWCAQGGRGSGCGGPKVATDGTVEWEHGSSTFVEHLDGVADVFVVRMDALRPDDGEHDVTKAIVLSAEGSFTEDQAEAYALSILRAVRQLDAGLPGNTGRCPGRARGAAVAGARPRTPQPAGRQDAWLSSGTRSGWTTSRSWRLRSDGRCSSSARTCGRPAWTGSAAAVSRRC